MSAVKPFIGPSFLLDNNVSEKLYFEYAEPLPLIDYHNHLPPKEIAENRQFHNLSQIWLEGDHYKWRAMRTWGIEERFITGDASDEQKFQKWAETTPHTIRNPLFHWTHLELQRYFGISELLNPQSAHHVYEQANEQLQAPEFTTQSLLKKMNVEVLCTTDDPLDDLYHHQNLGQKDLPFKVLPTWRPDKAIALEDISSFNKYVNKLSDVAVCDISDLDSFLQALQIRHDYFGAQGCKLSDRGLTQVMAVPFTTSDLKNVFDKALQGKALTPLQIAKLKSYLLLELARMDHAKGWVQQYHIGALRNNNTRMLASLGADSGFDSIGDYPLAQHLSAFLDQLDQTDQLAKTILYNLNPADNEVIATMVGNFNDGSIRGKMQFGSGWWFLDQLDGMEKQLNTLSNMSLLSCFVGMLTDSRSFMSFPRHEYFRRLLCNILGTEIQKGFIPEDYELVGALVQNVCHHNAKAYFGF